jgi:hypothetical protein
MTSQNKAINTDVKKAVDSTSVYWAEHDTVQMAPIRSAQVRKMNPYNIWLGGE